MRILLSAFACQPFAGSEGGVGWRWVEHLSREHEVVVLTDPSRRAQIEQAQHLLAGRRVQFHYYRPRLMRGWRMGTLTAHALYVAWNLGVWRLARRLVREQRFDYAHHLTYGVYRHASALGFLGIPFVFGPVGGGEEAPPALWRHFPWQDKLKELARSLSNRLFRFEPLLRASLRRATLILVRTEETRHALPPETWPRVVVAQEIGVESPDALPAAAPYDGRRPLRLFFGGRLLHWKGVHLLLKALAQARARGLNASLDIVGDGSKRVWLQDMARRLGLVEGVRWHGAMPQSAFLASLRQADLMVFPSLHDSGGNVSLEAMANGVPLVILDLGGPKTLVTPEAAVIVPTPGRSEAQVVADIAAAMLALAADPARLQRMRQRAREHAATMSWSLQIERVLAHIRKALAQRPEQR